jgi:organic radical activating enzyme
MKHLIKYVEFYITNACNLNCPECNRYNNYKFAGQQSWNDLQSTYAKWASKVDIKTCSILGGEPLLNPTINDWIYGVRDLWPDLEEILLLTNGTLIKKWSTIYTAVQKNQVTIAIHVHNKHDREKIVSSIMNELQHPIEKSFIIDDFLINSWSKSYNSIRDITWPECNDMADFEKLPLHIQQECINVHNFSKDLYLEDIAGMELKDANGVKVMIELTDFFRKSALTHDKDTGKFHLHNNDQEEAWNKCNFKTCQHFVEGKLYKCGPVALLPEFNKQFGISLEPSNLNLLNNYIPLLHDSDPRDFDHFLNEHLNGSIPQCKFCSVDTTAREFQATTNKLNIKKHNNGE